ncbi:MAG: M23 family metallopeptidase [Bacteroidota bacterium]|nr:M23 family metallopeptidase [Bacteroidota bacterium]
MNEFFFKKYNLQVLLLFFIFLAFSSISNAQYFPIKNYPKNYFIYPVDARISLAANFGELRPNHYHMGLDCRTNHVINRPVKAAAEGYIARVSIEPFGFGQAIYINHPNGLTTVYGHLQSFIPELAKYLKRKQYEQKSWKVDLEIPPGLFPVKRGQLIAYSGSTGGSQGPHCHFEIRDTKTGKVLNELLFGLPIPDNVPPSIVGLYMYDRNKSTYSQTPESLPIKKVNGKYITNQNIITVHSDKISFGISANDKQSGSTNPNGIYEAIIYLDNLPLSAFEIDSISYDETRYVNAHIDYKTRAAGGPFIEHLSRLPGYPQGVYKDINGNGVIKLTDSDIHQVKIVVKDANNNTSVLEFKIQKGSVAEKEKQDTKASYYEQKEFHPGFVNVFESNDLQLYIKPETLYDSVAFTHSEQTSAAPHIYSAVHSILSGLVPAQDDFTVRIKANKPIEQDLTDKILMKRTWHGKSEVIKATKDSDWYTAKFRAFGDFELVADNEPPVINVSFHNNAILTHATRIIITPRDNNDEIKSFRAELDGKWLCFSNDKGRSFIYYFDEMCRPGKHELKIYVQDEAGNTAEKLYHFTR